MPGELLTLVPVGVDADGKPRPAGATVTALEEQADVLVADPVFKVGGNYVVAADLVIVGFADLAQKAALASEFGLTEVAAGNDTAVFQLPARASAFDMLPRLEQDAAVRYVEPDFITIGKHLPKRFTIGVDPLVAPPVVGQYAMRLTRALRRAGRATGRSVNPDRHPERGR